MDPRLYGYLIVLNSPLLKSKLTEEQRQLGETHIVGCLQYVEDYFQERDQDIYSLIKQRENINGRRPLDDPELMEITTVTSNAIFDYLDLGCN